MKRTFECDGLLFPVADFRKGLDDIFLRKSNVVQLDGYGVLGVAQGDYGLVRTIRQFLAGMCIIL